MKPNALAQTDDFAGEVKALRNSPKFQAFLEERMICKTKYPIEEIEKELG